MNALRLGWSYTFRVEVPPDAIYERLLAPDRFFSFYPGYRGLVSVEGEWPNEGASLTVRYGLLPGCNLRLHQRVLRHVAGEYLELHEEALGGLWRDRPRFHMRADGGATDVTLTVEPSSRLRAATPLLWIMAPVFIPLGRMAIRKFKRIAEGE
jgi:hypothetical protein